MTLLIPPIQTNYNFTIIMETNIIHNNSPQQPISGMESSSGPRIEVFFITCCVGGIFFATTISLIVIICCCKFNKLNNEIILNKLSTANKDQIGETQTTVGQSAGTTISDYRQSLRTAQGSAIQLTPMSNPLTPGMMTTQTAHNLMQQLQTLQFLLSQQIAKENLQTQLSIDNINNSIGHNHTYPYHHSINNSTGNGNNYPPNLVRSASVQPQIDVLPIQRQRRLSVDNSPFKKVPIQHHLNILLY